MEARFALGDGCLVRYEDLTESSSGHGLEHSSEAGFENAVSDYPFTEEKHAQRCSMALLLSLYHLCLENRSNPDASPPIRTKPTKSRRKSAIRT